MANQNKTRMSGITRFGKTKHTPWDNKTSTSWLHGVEYWVLESPDDIYDYANTVVRKELEEDLLSMGKGSNTSEIIDSLATRRWKLEIVTLSDIRLNPTIMESYDVKTGAKFQDRLKQRTSELRRVLDQGRASIWPLVLVDSQRLLVDGYCRHSTLMEMGISRAFCYSGIASKNRS